MRAALHAHALWQTKIEASHRAWFASLARASPLVGRCHESTRQCPPPPRLPVSTQGDRNKKSLLTPYSPQRNQKACQPALRNNSLPTTHLKRQLTQHPETPLQQHGLVHRHVELVDGFLEGCVCVLVRPKLDAVGLQLAEGSFFIEEGRRSNSRNLGRSGSGHWLRTGFWLRGLWL